MPVEVAIVLANVCGWIYFCCWTFSFYPQIILNYQRQSVSGLNFDFITYNLSGLFFYTIYNTALYFSNSLKTEFTKRYNIKYNPVQLNDVFFAGHGFLLMGVTCFQCFIYKTQKQSVTRFCIYITMFQYFLVMLLLFIISTNRLDMSWLTWFMFISLMKLFSTLVKYIPQVRMNWKRRSTFGWSVVNVLLDFSGGFLSILQMFILSYIYGDWWSLLLSPTKLGLGIITLLFDTIFLLQHYWWFRGLTPTDSDLYQEADGTSAQY